MTTPRPAVAVVGIGADGWTEMESSLLPERTTSAAAFHKPWWRGVRFFHRDGHCYEVASAFPATALLPLSKLLANTFYNPRLVVQYQYAPRGRYDVRDLREALGNASDKDDDILTQFRDADELKERLARAQAFDDIVAVLEFAALDTDQPGKQEPLS